MVCSSIFNLQNSIMKNMDCNKTQIFACNELYRIQNTFSAFISRICAIFWPKRKLLLCLLLQHFKYFLNENIVAIHIKILQANSLEQNILFLLANHPNFSASKYWLRILRSQSQGCPLLKFFVRLSWSITFCIIFMRTKKLNI